jgi:hypothetical protein
MLAVGISDLTKILSEALTFKAKRKEHTREQLIEFLEKIAEDARSLADAWGAILVEIKAREAGPSSPHHSPKLSLQQQIFTRLAVFYENASRVIEGRMDTDWRSSIFDRLAALMHTRNITRSMYESQLIHYSSPFILGSGRKEVVWSNIESSVAALNKEAATLEALVVSFKASAAN